MSTATSGGTSKTYGVQRVCAAWEIARSTLYAQAAAARPDRPAQAKRGPKTALSDDGLVAVIRAVLAASAFTGEGYRNVWAKLRAEDVRAGKRRVLRLMGAHGLLAPQRGGSPRGPQAHDGTIITEAPDLMWGTDFSTTVTLREGTAAVFIAVDHCTAELVGVHAAPRATRWEALEPIRQAVRESASGGSAKRSPGGCCCATITARSTWPTTSRRRSRSWASSRAPRSFAPRRATAARSG
jgi:hypothetical protein